VLDVHGVIVNFCSVGTLHTIFSHSGKLCFQRPTSSLQHLTVTIADGDENLTYCILSLSTVVAYTINSVEFSGDTE